MQTRSSAAVVSPDREVIALSDYGVPDALKLGRVHYRKAQSPLTEHRHPGAMEICFLARGHQTYATHDGVYQLKGGDVFVSYPDEPHGTGGRPEEKSILYYLILSMTPHRGGFLGHSGPEGQRLRKALLSIPRRHFAGQARLATPLESILREYRDPDEFLALRLRMHLTDFLLRILQLAGQPQAGDVSPVIRTIHGEIQRRLRDEIRLEDLARCAGLSLSHFKQRFRKETGLPPREYILRAKVEHARKAIETTGRPITDIAYDLGFSSSQYFATVFKRYTGHAPRDCQP